MQKPDKYDFSGWVTKTDILCTDGRTIKKGAFSHQDGEMVPLVWQHCHDNPENIIGHIYLEDRDEGVYGYGVLNNNPRGKAAREGVINHDITSMSIFAHHLNQDSAKNVLHGTISEVSLVLAGANKGAKIDYVMAHSDQWDPDTVAAIIKMPTEDIELQHADQNTERKDENMANEEKKPEAEGKTLQEVFDTLNEEQKQLVYILVAEAKEEGKIEGEEEPAPIAQSDEEKDPNKTLSHEENKEDDMSKQNTFDNNTENTKTTLTHDALNGIMASAKANHRSLRESVKDAGYTDSDVESLLHGSDTLAHSITSVGNFFPEHKLVNNQPVLIARDQAWVGKLLGAVRRSPFSRIRSFAADITADDARAKGYVTGTEKVEEVISALHRTTDPQTVYKLQKLNRDDVLDITDFNVVEFIKSEMRTMLNEEVARDILIGDGRSVESSQHVDETKIRPIWKDNGTYSIKVPVTYTNNDTDTSKLKKIIRAIVKSRKDYRGSGNPVMFTTEDLLTDMLLMEDNNGRVIYDTPDRLARALRVSEIVTVPVMENKTRAGSGDDTGYTFTLKAILVNPTDYTCGADRGGAVTMFDDFDIDYNKMEYLIETRMSGALTIPYSAIVVEEKAATV